VSFLTDFSDAGVADTVTLTYTPVTSAGAGTPVAVTLALQYPLAYEQEAALRSTGDYKGEVTGFIIPVAQLTGTTCAPWDRITCNSEKFTVIRVNKINYPAEPFWDLAVEKKAKQP
jgi:hypothetical protein